jgi:hypothetical protein
MELNEWTLRNNEYPEPPFSDSRSDNRFFSPLTFGQPPKAQIPINPGTRGSTSSDLHPCQPLKRNWLNNGVGFLTPPPQLYKYIHILLSSKRDGLLNARKRCSMQPIHCTRLGRTGVNPEFFTGGRGLTLNYVRCETLCYKKPVINTAVTKHCSKLHLRTSNITARSMTD